MPARFTTDDVQAVADLANLELDSRELELFAHQLGDILAYAEQVQQVDTADVPPTAYVAIHQAGDRPDEVRPCLDRDEALANAPEAARDAGLFKVPRVIA